MSFSMLSSRLLTLLSQAENTGKGDIKWSQWGKRNCRVELENFWDQSCACSVYGTQAAVHGGDRVIIRDFNPHSLQDLVASRNRGETQGVHGDWVVSDTHTPFDIRRLFSDNIVNTSLYRMRVTKLELSESDSVMLSEDSIVIVKVFLQFITLRVFTDKMCHRRISMQSILLPSSPEATGRRSHC